VDYEFRQINGEYRQMPILFNSSLVFRTDWLPNLQDFGRNQVILTFNGSDVHIANIEIFFPALGFNHPPGPPKGIGFLEDGTSFAIRSPNWMYYYYHAHPEENVMYHDRWINVYSPLDDTIFIGDCVVEGFTGPGRPIQLEEDAGTDIRRFITIRPLKPYGPECRVEGYFVYGIDAFVRAVAHERKHRLIYLDYHSLIEQSERDGESLDDPYDDPDNDGLPNAVERAEGLNPDKSDTIELIPLLEKLTGVQFPFEYHAADQEILADRVAFGSFGNKDLDWSDLGLNKWRGRAVPREVMRVLRKGS